MSTVEIILLIAGLLAFIGSFFLPDKGGTEVQQLSQEELKERLDAEIENSRSRIDDITEESIQYSMERTERALDKIANEKIMAVGDYSDTVLNQIAANHQETVFLHDMLNRSKDELTELLNRAEKSSKEANKSAEEAYSLATGAKRLAEDVQLQVEKLSSTAVVAEEKMIDARRMLQENPPVQEAPVPTEEVKEEAWHGEEDYPGSFPTLEEEAKPPVKEKLSEEEMMEKILKEATAGLGEERRSQPKAPAEPKEVREPVIPQVAADPAELFKKREVEPERSSRTTVKRKPRSSVKKAEEILGQLSIPTEAAVAEPLPSKKEELPPRREAVSLQFKQGGGDSANNNERILQMHRMGRSNMAIAKDLGLGIGEVKLVIDLYENM
ncbi:MAG: hypothetical protein IK115_09100 [Lachnospiraceae bacterium]|nr:hypothetical protein [Lachnospiraceae bacterium]